MLTSWKSVRPAWSIIALAAGCQSAAAPQRSQSSSPPLLWELKRDGPGPRQDDVEPKRDAPDQLSVLSFNMQHRDQPQELDVMADYLRGAEGVPDFILCQEVLFDRSFLDVPASTAAVLGGELGFFTRGTQRHGNREGVAIVSRYPFIYYDELHLKARSSVFVPGFRRVSVMGEFTVPLVGRVRVVNTHLTNWPMEGGIRLRQLQETLDWVTARQQDVPAEVTILGGDLNATREKPELAPIADPRWAGAKVLCDGNTDLATFGANGRAYKRIDYIFAAAPGGGITMLDERVLFADGLWRRDGSARFWISDHLPVLHEYALAPRTAAVP
jgi:endonuclease/exonuclease/phosphatase family metal-dependent hydrolase